MNPTKKENTMTPTNITSAAAHVQGLQAFMAMEEKAAATDTALEAAAKLGTAAPTSGHFIRVCQ